MVMALMTFVFASAIVILFVGSIPTTVYADTCAMTVTVTVSKVVTISGSPLTFGSVAAGGGNSAVSSGGCTVTNTGSTTESYNLQLTAVPAGWSVLNATGPTGSEQIKLLALFTSATGPSSTAFLDATDIVCSTGTINASSTVYGVATEPASLQGYSCSATAARTLWFEFVAPLSTVLTTQQWLTVTVSAY
jgi:hypothetical protein